MTSSKPAVCLNCKRRDYPTIIFCKGCGDRLIPKSKEAGK